jgi:glutaryl-CoA dehydrogenase
MDRRARWASFDSHDPFLIDEQISEEERMAKDTAAAYAANQLLPRVIDAYREETTDTAIFREMGALGLLGPMLEGYGCAGMGYTSYGLLPVR